MTVSAFGPAPIDAPELYPGRWPDGAVVIADDVVTPLDMAEQPAAILGRTPVLAVGSNACPAQLARKGLSGAVVMIPTVLRNHVVVYAGHQSLYGAVPATVMRWPGARSTVFAIWLTHVQHSVVDLTEARNYSRVMLPTDDGLMAGYRATTGYFIGPGRRPIRLPGVAVEGPAPPLALNQVELSGLRRGATG